MSQGRFCRHCSSRLEDMERGVCSRRACLDRDRARLVEETKATMMTSFGIVDNTSDGFHFAPKPKPAEAKKPMEASIKLEKWAMPACDVVIAPRSPLELKDLRLGQRVRVKRTATLFSSSKPHPRAGMSGAVNHLTDTITSNGNTQPAIWVKYDKDEKRSMQDWALLSDLELLERRALKVGDRVRVRQSCSVEDCRGCVGVINETAVEGSGRKITWTKLEGQSETRFFPFCDLEPA
jgi:hypothetical protein